MKIIFLVSLLLALAPTSLGWQSAGNVQGVVTTRGSVLPGTTVTAINIADQSINRSTSTNAQGKYELNGLLPGTYYMSFTKAGFSEGSSENVVINANQTTEENKELFPDQLNKLFGRVFDTNGAAISGATIVAFDQKGERGSATSDSDGAYQLLLPPGKYRIRVEAAGFKSAEVTDVNLTADQQMDLPVALGDVSDTIDVSSIGDTMNQRRPGVTRPAEFQSPGELQLELGYDGNFHARNFHDRQTVPMSISLALSRRVLLDASVETLRSESSDPDGRRTLGFNDIGIGLQMVALHQTTAHPSLSFAYQIKFDRSDQTSGPCCVSHRITTLMSKSVNSGRSDFDFNSSLLILGPENRGGWITGGQVSLAYSQRFLIGPGHREVTAKGEISYQSKDYLQPTGVYLLGSVIHKVNPRFSIDSGLRFGLNPSAPRVGVFAGVTWNFAKLF